MLDFYHSLDASKSNYVNEMIIKGVDWANRTKTGKLSRKDALMSFFAQLLQGINWGLVAVVITPMALQKFYQDLY